MDPDPVRDRRIDPDHQAKIVKKYFDSYCFVTVTSFIFLSLKNYVNVPSKSIKQKNAFNKIRFLLAP
jgi:hypothetical protein